MDVRSEDVARIGCSTNIIFLLAGYLLFTFTGLVKPNTEIFFYSSITGGGMFLVWLILFVLSWDTKWDDSLYILFGCLVAGSITLGILYYFGSNARTEAQQRFFATNGLDKHLTEYLEAAKGSESWNIVRKDALKKGLTEYLKIDKESKFLSIFGKNSPLTAVGKNYLVGKVVAVELKEKNFDPVMYDLPQELWAASHKEVGTVIQILRKKKLIGYYSGGTGGGAYVLQAEIRVIDFKQKLVLSVKLVQGSIPPSKKSSSGDSTGSQPDKKIVEYINSLKRKKESIEKEKAKPSAKKS